MNEDDEARNAMSTPSTTAGVLAASPTRQTHESTGSNDDVTAPTVRYVAHVMMDEGVERQSPPATESVQAFALLAFTVVLWPLSFVPLLLMLGPRRTWILLTNLGYTTHHPWDDARVRGPHFARGWWPLRVSVLCMHHGTTIMYIAALALWAASPKPAASTDAADSWPAPSVTSAVLAFQLLSTLASMLARRLAFATFVFGNMLSTSARPRWAMREVTRSPTNPLRTFSPMQYSELLATGIGAKPMWLSAVARLRGGQSLDAPVMRITTSAYRVLYSAANATGDSMTMVPLAGRATAPREVRLPSGHVALAIRRAPPFRSHFVRALLASADVLHDNDHDVEAVAAVDVELEHDVECDASVYLDTWLLTRGSIFNRTLLHVALALMLVGLCVAATPISIRGGMLGAGYAFGSNSMEHASAALLLLTEILIALAPAVHGGMITLAGYCGSRHMSAVLVHLLHPRVGDASSVHVVRQLQTYEKPPTSPPGRFVSAAPATVTVEWLPMHASALSPLSAPPLQRAVRTSLAAVALSGTELDALQGAWILDTVAATRACANALHALIENMSTTGLGHTTTSVGSVSSVTSLLLSGALSVAFSVSPDLIASGGLGGTTNVTVLRHAAIVPTVCMLLSFLANCAVLLAAFREASLIISQLRAIEAIVLQAMSAAAAVMSERASQRRQLLHALAAAQAKHDDAATDARRHEVADVDSDLTELTALLEAHRVLLERVRTYLHNAGGIRFLGIFRAGAASVGGLLALMTSATVLALRLVSAARGGGFLT